MSDTTPSAFGPYARLARLGRGAAGAAYLARPFDEDRGVPTPFVLKLLHADLDERSDFLERFIHEAQIAVSIDSPHVASVFDVGQVGKTHYIALEYVPGWTFGKVLVALGKHAGDSPLPIVHALAAQAARGLGALHAATTRDGQPLQAVHRDVSAKNVMVGANGRVSVIDLGLMKSTIQSWETKAGRVMGSPGYMAPEQVRAQPVDRRTDLYALGVITHELLTKTRYVPIGEPLDMLRAVIRAPFAPPSINRPGLPREVDDFCARAMAADLDGRFTDADDFIRGLQESFPPPATADEVQEFLRRLIPDDFASRAREVERLIRLPLPTPPDGPDEPATVYVRRPGVAPEPEGTRVVPTRVLGAPLPPAARSGPRPRSPVRGLPAAGAGPMLPERSSSGSEPGAPPLAGAPAPMTSLTWSGAFRSRASTPWGLVALVGIALGIGFGAGAWFMRAPQPAPVVIESGPLPSRSAVTARPEAASPAPSARPAASPRPEDVSATPGVAARPAAAPRPTEAAPSTAVDERPAPPPRRPSRARPRPTPAAPAPAPPAPDALATRAARLQARALALKADLPAEDPRRQRLDQLLARLAMVKAAGFTGSAGEQLDGLAKDLTRLAAE